MRSLDRLGFDAGDLAIVTGGGSGVGKSVVEGAVALGLRVALWDLDAARAQTVAGSLDPSGQHVVPITCDVTKAHEVEQRMAQTRTLGTPRYLVNNACPSSAVPTEWDAGILGVVGSVRLVTEAFLAARPPAGSAVVNVASTAGNFTARGVNWYAAGKAAVAGYTRNMALVDARAVRFNAVAPSIIDTPRTQAILPERAKQLMVAHPLGRPATADEVAAAILFLLSPLASYVNGVLLPVDGGGRWAYV